MRSNTVMTNTASIWGVRVSHSGDQVVRLPLDFTMFYRNEYRKVLGFSYALSGSQAAAEDICQEAFLRAHREWDRVGSFEYPGAWVRRVASNLAMSQFRKVRSESKALLRLASQRQEPFSDPDPEFVDFWEQVRRLPQRQAEVVVLFYLEDRSVAEIARMLGVAEGSVKASLHKGRRTLATALGMTLEES